MPKKERFYCTSCSITFEILVEPDYSTDELRMEYKQALKWLNGVKTCPVCGYTVSVRPKPPRVGQKQY